MDNSRFSHRWRWCQPSVDAWHHPLAIPVLLAVCLGLGVLAWQFRLGADTTHNHRNTLSAPSQQVLKQLPGRIEITAFCSNSPYKGRYFRKSISALIQRYQSSHTDIHLQFIDPASAPSLARQAQIQKEGEMIVRYHGQSRHMYLPYTEEAFTNLLLALQHGQRAPLVFASGHGETALAETTAAGGSQLAEAMREAGLQTRSQRDWSTAPAAGQQVATLVLAGARESYDAAEQSALQNHLRKGGNLVWLLDSPQAQGLNSLATALGVSILPGMIIDPANQPFEIPLHALSTQRYGAQGPTQDFALRTFFDQAHAIDRPRQPNDPWRMLPLVAVAEQGWVSRHYTPSERSQTVHFQADTDTPGPLTVVAALEKDRPSGEKQRILIIGSSRFFTNQQQQKGGNQALSMQMLRWVVNNQPSISLTTPPLRDSVIALPDRQTWLMVLFNGFQFGLPAFLLSMGWWRWRMKHRQ